VTLVAQHANAEKSKVVKQTTYRGIMVIAANKGFRGPLPALWSIRGQRYRKQAFCADPERVRAIYERVAEGGSVAKVAREFNLYPVSVRGLVRFEANHTGVIECRYSYRGVTETWTHEVEPVVDSPLWWRANKALKANKTPARANKGGRPVAQSDRWISGLLDCPACGGRLYLNEGMTAAGNPRTARLRCGGQRKVRVMCGVFTGCDAQPMIDTVEAMFAGDSTPILAFQRIAGNTHELDGLRASLAKIQARLSATEDDDELDALVAQRKRAKAAVEDFKIVPDSFDYAPTGQTVAGMWAGDDTVKRGMVAAVKRAWGLALTEHEGQWTVKVGAGCAGADASEIVDLGNGLCFRR
jgi:hypothetical protein